MTDEERIEEQWRLLLLALESNEPLVRSKEFIERSDRIFAANHRPADPVAWAARLAGWDGR